MPTRRIEFDGAEGRTIAARLELPVGGSASGVALFAHCFTCSKDLRAVVEVSRGLSERGLGVLRFDFTGLGESEGDFADTDFSSNVSDLLAAAEYLERAFEAPALLVGHSLGGAAALKAAASLPSIRAVATIGAPAAPSHVTHLLESSREEIERTGSAVVTLAGRTFRIRRSFLDDVEGTPIDECVAGLGRPLLLFHAPEDEVVGVENAEQLYRTARHPKSFVSLDGADHLLTREGDARYVAEVLAAWAARYLEPSDPEMTREGHVFTRTGSDGFLTRIVAGGHAMVADEPRGVGGTDEGPAPYDLLLAALGACTGMTLRLYADRKKWPLEAASVSLSHRRVHAADCEACADDPPRLTEIERRVELTGALSAGQRDRLLEIAGRCPVHRTLEGPIDVKTVEVPDAGGM